jgi:hypothetical protein
MPVPYSMANTALKTIASNSPSIEASARHCSGSGTSRCMRFRYSTTDRRSTRPRTFALAIRHPVIVHKTICIDRLPAKSVDKSLPVKDGSKKLVRGLPEETHAKVRRIQEAFDRAGYRYEVFDQAWSAHPIRVPAVSS